MSLYRKENNFRKAQARFEKVSKQSKQFQVRFQREQNNQGRFHTRAYIERGEKEHHSGRGIIHKAVNLKYRVKGDKPSVTRTINSFQPKSKKASFLRICLVSFKDNTNKSKRKHLKRILQKSFTIFPKSATFVNPSKRTFYNPSFGQSHSIY